MHLCAGALERLPSLAAPCLPTNSYSPWLHLPKQQGILPLLLLSSYPWIWDGWSCLLCAQILPAPARGTFSPACSAGSQWGPQQQREAGAAHQDSISCCSGQVHLEFVLLVFVKFVIAVKVFRPRDLACLLLIVSVCCVVVGLLLEMLSCQVAQDDKAHLRCFRLRQKERCGGCKGRGMGRSVPVC